MKLRSLHICAALLLGLLPAGTGLAISWPGDAEWTALTYGLDLYVDALATASGGDDNFVTIPEPEVLDLVGGYDHHGAGPFAAGFSYQDNDYLMFRIRVDNEPTLAGPGADQLVWTVMLNTDGDPDVDWVVQLDQKQHDQVELVPAISGGPQTAVPWDPVVLSSDELEHVGFDSGEYARTQNATATDGSHFHDEGPEDDDFFIDIAYPLATFLSRTGLPADFTYQAALATSATDTLINKDIPDHASWIPTVALVPEPATWVGFITGLTLLLAASPRRRRTRA